MSSLLSIEPASRRNLTDFKKALKDYQQGSSARPFPALRHVYNCFDSSELSSDTTIQTQALWTELASHCRAPSIVEIEHIVQQVGHGLQAVELKCAPFV